MRMSRLFSQTLREAPAEAEIASHQLLLRAGFIRQLAAGIFSYLPLARRSMTKIENIMREEMDAIGGQEITMPVVHPAELWQETGPLVPDRRRDGALQGPHRARYGAGDDPRRGRRRPGARRDPLVPPAARPDLPHPDQVARRPAPARRADPGARVHHEGQLQPGRRLGGPGRASTAPTTRPTSTSSTAAGCR